MSKPALVLVLFGFLAPGKADAEIRTQATAPIADIRAQQLELREELTAKNGPYKNMSPGKRNELMARQDQLLTLIDGKATLEELSEADKALAFDSLEWINATIADNDDHRIVCERTRPVGSNRVERVCSTVAERRASREAALRSMGDLPTPSR